MNPPDKNKKRQRTPGEPMVWFSGLGLTLGLLMVAGLLAVIIYNGVAVFWPARVARISLVEGKNSPVGRDFFAVLVREREKVASHGTGAQEQLLFAGNKNFLGTAYFYNDTDSIARTDYPKSLLRIERAEFGDALIDPVSLTTREGKVVPVGDSDFAGNLEKLTAQSQEIRNEISRLEKSEIGYINAKIRDVRLDILKNEDMAHVATDSEKKVLEARLAELQATQSALNAEYEKLAVQTAKFREKLKAGVLTGRMGDNREVTISAGDILDYYAPNEIGFGSRLAVFLGNIWGFLSDDPREANTEGGVFPAIFGTFCMTVLMSALVTPFGVIAAIYLREYAKQGLLVRWVRICVNNLAGVPSIVFGVFGFGFFVYIAGGAIDSLLFSDSLKYTNSPVFGTGGILWASLTLAFMTLPVVIVATEEALAAVPRGAREASLACGASKWQTIQRIVVPAAAPGILTGVILSMARGAGEVAPLMMVGVVKLAPSLPFDGTFPFIHLDRKFMHLGFHIYDLGFQSPDSDAAQPMVFATALLLIVLVLVLNAGAIHIRNHLRKKYQVGAF